MMGAHASRYWPQRSSGSSSSSTSGENDEGGDVRNPNDSSASGVFPYASLPPGISQHVLQFLTPRELALNVSLVNRDFRDAVRAQWQLLEMRYTETFRQELYPLYYMGSPPPTIDEFNQMRRVDDGGLSESDVEDIDPLLVCALKQIHEEGEAGYVAPAVAKAAVAAASTASASASSATNAPAKLPDDGSAIALSTESTSTSTSTSASASSTDSSSESTSSSTPSTSTSSSSVDAHSPPSALTPEASVYALTVLNGREETEGAKMRKLRRAEHEEKIKKDTPEFTQLYESLLKSIGSRTITPVLHHDSLTPSPHGFLLSHGLSVAASPLARPPRPQDTALVNTLGTTSSVAPLPDGFAATSTMGYVLGFMHDSESISRKERLDLLVQDPHFRALGQSLATFFPDSERIVNNIAESYLSLTERMQVDTSVELAYSGGGSVQGCYPTAVTVCDDMVAVGGRSSGPGQADAIHQSARNRIANGPQGYIYVFDSGPRPTLPFNVPRSLRQGLFGALAKIEVMLGNFPPEEEEAGEGKQGAKTQGDEADDNKDKDNAITDGEKKSSTSSTSSSRERERTPMQREDFKAHKLPPLPEHMPKFRLDLTLNQRRALLAWSLVHARCSSDMRSDFQRGVYFLMNNEAHEAPVTALAGWREPFGEDMRDVANFYDLEEAKAPHPFGRIVSGSNSGVISVWSLCCGERLCSWQAHQGAVSSLHTLSNGDVISTSLDGTVKCWALIEDHQTRELNKQVQIENEKREAKAQRRKEREARRKEREAARLARRLEQARLRAAEREAYAKKRAEEKKLKRRDKKKKKIGSATPLEANREAQSSDATSSMSVSSASSLSSDFTTTASATATADQSGDSWESTALKTSVASPDGDADNEVEVDGADHDEDADDADGDDDDDDADNDDDDDDDDNDEDIAGTGMTESFSLDDDKEDDDDSSSEEEEVSSSSTYTQFLLDNMRSSLPSAAAIAAATANAHGTGGAAAAGANNSNPTAAAARPPSAAEAAREGPKFFGKVKKLKRSRHTPMDFFFCDHSIYNTKWTARETAEMKMKMAEKEKKKKEEQEAAAAAAAAAGTGTVMADVETKESSTSTSSSSSTPSASSAASSADSPTSSSTSTSSSSSSSSTSTSSAAEPAAKKPYIPKKLHEVALTDVVSRLLELLERESDTPAECKDWRKGVKEADKAAEAAMKKKLKAREDSLRMEDEDLFGDEDEDALFDDDDMEDVFTDADGNVYLPGERRDGARGQGRDGRNDAAGAGAAGPGGRANNANGAAAGAGGGAAAVDAAGAGGAGAAGAAGAADENEEDVLFKEMESAWLTLISTFDPKFEKAKYLKQTPDASNPALSTATTASSSAATATTSSSSTSGSAASGSAASSESASTSSSPSTILPSSSSSSSSSSASQSTDGSTGAAGADAVGLPALDEVKTEQIKDELFKQIGAKGHHFIYPCVYLVNELTMPPNFGPVRTLVREGAMLFVGGDGGICVFDARNGKLEKHLLAGQEHNSYGRCNALVVAGGVMFASLSARPSVPASAFFPPDYPLVPFNQDEIDAVKAEERRLASLSEAAALVSSRPGAGDATSAAAAGAAGSRSTSSSLSSTAGAIASLFRSSTSSTPSSSSTSSASTTAPADPADPAAPAGPKARIEAIDWLTGKRLYTLYHGKWAVNSLAIRFPPPVPAEPMKILDEYPMILPKKDWPTILRHSEAMRKKYQSSAVVIASLDDTERQGRCKTWTWNLGGVPQSSMTPPQEVNPANMVKPYGNPHSGILRRKDHLPPMNQHQLMRMAMERGLQGGNPLARMIGAMGAGMGLWR